MISLKHLSEDNTHSLALAALLVGGLVMGFSPVFVREAEVGAFASAFWRVLFALPLLYVWARIEKRQDPTSKSFAITPSLLLAGVMFSGDLIFWHLAILNTTMANATFMVCLSPVWVAVFSGIFLNEPINKQAWLGLAICLIGLAMLINSSLTIDPSRLIGDIYGLITSFFLGFYFLAMRRGRRNLKSGALFFGSTVITTIVLLIAALAAGDRLIPDTSSGWASLISLGVLTHAGGQGLVTFAIGTLSAIFSSLVIFIEAVAAAFFGWLLFDEAMTPIQIAGGTLILCGVWISRPSYK